MALLNRYFIICVLYCILTYCSEGCCGPTIKTCAPRISDSVDTVCELEGRKLDCSKPLPERTRVRMSCKPVYETTDHSPNHVSQCRDGTWDYAIIRCEPVCGRKVSRGESLIMEDLLANKNDLPWHVGIYKRDGTDTYNQLCTGSIIRENVVVSVAHCFTSASDGSLYDAKKYAVAAGKFFRGYNDVRDTVAQQRLIKQIVIPPSYRGELTSFSGDIALVVLEKPFIVNQMVQPVCIDWNNEHEKEQLKEPNTGLIAGWSHPDPELKKETVPYVSSAHCSANAPQNFLKYITSDKFCTGFQNDTNLCNGSAGGGLVFRRHDKYYLRGLLSIAPKNEGTCGNIKLFTRISHYLDMLRTVEVSNRT